jgi:hypothetical protein
MKQKIISGICLGRVLMLRGLFAFTAQSPIDPAQAREVFARARVGDGDTRNVIPVFVSVFSHACLAI